MIIQVSDSLTSNLQQVFEEKSLLMPLQIKGIREEAFNKFMAVGFPSMKNEDWKYTNLKGILSEQDLTIFDGRKNTPLNVKGCEPGIKGLDAYKLYVINGQFDPSQSDQVKVDGVHVLAYADALEHPVFTKHFAQHADRNDSAMVALNTALASEGLFIHVEKNVVLDKPIHIIRVAAADKPLFTMTRNLVVVDAFAEVEVLESFVSAGEGFDAVSVNHQVTEVVLAENAKVQHYMVQTSNEAAKYVSHIEIHQRKHSLYNNYNANFPGADFVRNDINVRMDDPEVESHLYGLLLLNKNQFVDNHTIVDHMMPHGESYEWYKTITQDDSTAVFNGKIFVRLDAQKTNAFQQNNNVQIGEKSTVFSKPQLEIFADDVKCSHGCTIGQFDDESLFYLRARGIGEEQARVLLVQAFAFDVTSRFENDVIRAYVEQLIEKNLD